MPGCGCGSVPTTEVWGCNAIQHLVSADVNRDYVREIRGHEVPTHPGARGGGWSCEILTNVCGQVFEMLQTSPTQFSHLFQLFLHCVAARVSGFMFALRCPDGVSRSFHWVSTAVARVFHALFFMNFSTFCVTGKKK